MPFEEELARVLPAGIPNRERLIEKEARHLELIVSANERMNLTRITDPREAAIKHIYDSVAPWEHFKRARCVLDAGTGAGFPGIPLSIALPDVQFILAESVHKKAAFVDSAVDRLELPNVRVAALRAEEIALTQQITCITARAVAPVSRLIEVFAKPLKRGARILLYKGPDVESELAEAPRCRIQAEVLCRYDLPDAFGARTLIRIQAQSR
ncbi:MAG: 16S rRNA (guanine(527)-N(7))-methyltransferase RsmG [Bryobacteraceae bacterium]